MPIAIPLLDNLKKSKQIQSTISSNEPENQPLDSTLSSKAEHLTSQEIHPQCKEFEKECQYWLNCSSKANSPEEKDQAKLFYDLLSDLHEEILTFHLFPPMKALLVLDCMESCLENLVHENFPQSNWTHCFTMFTFIVLNYASSKAPLISTLSQMTSVPRLSQSLEPCVTILERWNQIIDLFTPSSLTESCSNSFLSFASKCFELNDIFACLLASIQAGAAIDAPQLLSPLENMKWDTDTNTWQSVIKQIEYLIQPCEIFLATNIKKTMKEDQHLLYRNWTKYIAIMKRVKIKKELRNYLTERKIMRAQIQSDLDLMESKLREFTITACTVTDTVADRLIWLQQSQERLRECDLIIQCIDLDKETYQLKKQQLQEEITLSQKHLLEEFQEFAFQLHQQLQSNASWISLQFKLNKLQVMFPDELGSLVQQVRQLMALHCPLHKDIVKLTEEAQKHFKMAIVLRQIAHFYNTIESQMLSFHRLLLLPFIDKFEKHVKQSINWKGLQQVQLYSQTLFHAAHELQTQTRYLQQTHTTMVSTLVKMLHYPGESQWKSGLQELHTLFANLNWTQDQLLPWKVHLQWQLYKIIRHNYAFNLKSYSLPELKMEVIAKNGKVMLRPPLEEVKMKYYRELKKLISQPTHFPGLIHQHMGYFDIIESNASHVIAMYQKAEETFDVLERKLQSFNEWVFLGALSNEKLMDYIQLFTTQIEDWEHHFKSLKFKGKEAEALGNSFKVDHLTCSLLPLKAFIDDYLQRLFDALVQTLFKSIQGHAKIIQQFLDHGIKLISITPKSVKELAEAKKIKFELQCNDMDYQMNQLQMKRKIFRGVTGTTPELGDLFDRYAQFDLMIKGHDMLIQDHHDQLFSQMQTRIEKLERQIERLSEHCSSLSTTDMMSNPLDDFLEQIMELEVQLSELESDSEYFNLPLPNFEQFNLLRHTLQQAYDARELLNSFHSILNPFLNCTLPFLQVEELKQELLSWKDKLGTQPLEKSNLEIYKQFDALWFIQEGWLTYFREIKTFTPQLWDEFCHILGILPVTHKVTLNALIPKASILPNVAGALFELNIRAKNEYVIREALQEVEMWSVSCTLQLSLPSSEKTGVPLLKDLKSIFSALGDQRATVASLLQTPNNLSFLEILGYWDQRLAQLDQYLRQLLVVQRKWVYLGPVIQALPPLQQQKFGQVDFQFKEIMKKVALDPKAIQLLNQSQLQQQLPMMVQSLEMCQKALLDYLELKRNSFPRFYFIGDEDLLEVLSQSNSSPLIVQAHLKKLFSGIHNVEMDGPFVTHILSAKKEKVQLLTPVAVTDQVDVWLSQLNNEIQKTLRSLLTECMQSGKSTKEETSFIYPEQIRDLVYRIQMTQKIEASIQSQTLSNLLESIKPLSYDAIYYSRIIQELIQAKVTRVDEFVWMKIVRYYYEKETCVIRIFDATFDYTFEYQGNPAKLVQAPLTDQCFATLGQAMSEGLGGCLYGQAGTGKTESVKHLGYLFGRQVLVFNCDEGLDVNSITRLFCGLVKCGAWGCFDEFNRLSSSVLAAVSNLVGTIQQALFQKSSTLILSGNTIELHPSACLFVTLNPVGKEYKGRQRLPHNLKQLFRNMAMTHPDIIYICQIELKALRFKSADMLGTLCVKFFQACKDILSPQKHYDWGLRALKAVLYTAGDLLPSYPDTDEMTLMMQSIKVNTESKLTGSDLTFFQVLLSAYFKSNEFTTLLDSFEKALENAYEELKLTPLIWQKKAVSQFYTACKQRMGVCLVGPPESGKATVVKLASQVMDYLGKSTKLFWTSPKAMSRSQLLGFLDPNTREWHDGVITFYSRETINSPEFHYLLVFDGDIDPEWVEALNSVLDDNRLLTMPNGERIKFEGNVNFIFITDSLTLASPATVTRMGIIYLDQVIPNDIQLNLQIENHDAGPLSTTHRSNNKLVLGTLGMGRKLHMKALCEKQEALWMQCSMQSNSEQLIQMILQHTNIVTTLRGQTLIPKSGVSIIWVIICDLDLPVKDNYNTVQVHQFIHQLIKHKGFHHPKSLEWMNISCLNIIGSATSKDAISNRLFYKFTCENLLLPTMSQFSELTSSSLQRCPEVDTDAQNKFRVILEKVFQKTENILAAKKWLKSIQYYLCSDPMERGDFPIEYVFLQFGLQCFPTSSELITYESQKLLTIPPILFNEALKSHLNEKHESILTIPQLLDFIQSFLIYLRSPFAILHIKVSSGIPANDVFHALANFLFIPLSFITYIKVATLNALLLQLKEALYVAGVQNKKSVLLIDSYACPTPEFYHAVHQVFSLHLVSETMMPDISEAEQAYQASTYSGSLSSFVLSRAISNLKLIISNIPEAWLPGFPNFISKGIFLQLDSWNISTQTFLTQDLDPPLASVLLNVYRASDTGATPRCLTHVLKLFKSIHQTLSARLQKKFHHLEQGLSKLTLTKSSVEELSKEAVEQEAALHEKQKLADATLKQITETMIDVSNQKVEMEQLSLELKIEEEKIEEQKKAIQAELAQVEPLIQQSKAAVSDIKPEHLSEVRSLRSPPMTVRDVLEGVLTLLGQQDLSWSGMKSVLGKRSFKEDILNFNASSITSSIRHQVEKLLKEKPDSFVEANVRKSSVAAAPLASWVIANLEFSKVLDKVKPLQNKLDKFNLSLDQSKQRIHEITLAVNSVDEKVNQLKTEFASKTGEAQKLADGLATTQTNLNRAHHLLHTLASEQERWQTEMEQLQTKLSQLNSISLCAAMYATWGTKLTEEGRKKFVEVCKNSLNLHEFDFSILIDSEDLQLEWEDSISMENVIVTTLSNQITYWIADGNGEGLLQIKKYYEQRPASEPPFKIISIQSDSYVKELEMAIRLGHRVLLMDVNINEPHAWLYAILRQDYLKIQGRCLLSLKDNKQLEVHPQFKLILYTSYAGWELLPSLKGHVIPLCWSTTIQGLQATLLKEITMVDAPELLAKLNELTSQEKAFKQELAMVETKMLEELNASEGNNILGNQKLLDTLLTAKSKGEVVSESLEASKKLHEDIKSQQAEYRHLLLDLSELYFLVRKLSLLHPNYRYNLQTYISWFKQTLELHPKTSGSSNLQLRLKQLLTSMIQLVYQQTALCLEPLHQLSFGFLLLTILKVISKNEIQAFCGFELTPGKDIQLPAWIPDSKKEALSRLSNLFDILSLLNQSNEDAWRKWMEKKLDTIPCACKPFQQLLLTSVLCPDTFFSCCVTFCSSNLTSIPTATALSKAVQNAKGRKPVLVFVPPGADPLKELDFSLVDKASLMILSLGEGMETIATKELERVMTLGGSLFVQNLQALPSFVSVCTNLLHTLGGTQLHFNCLLILSIEDQALQLPIELLEQCLLVRAQGTIGVYNNLRTLLLLQQTQPLLSLPSTSDRCFYFQKLFLVSWFHTVVQERRRFVPQAWRSHYEFGMNDFQSILKSLHLDLNTLQGLIQLIYGGKIDVPVDVHKLMLLVQFIVDENVLEKGGKMSLRKLIRGFDIPKSDQLQDFIDSIEGLKEIKEHVILQLPPNIYATLEGFKSKFLLDGIKLLLKNGESTTTTTFTSKVGSASLSSTDGPDSFSSFLQIWKASVHLPTYSPQNQTAVSHPLFAFLYSQYTNLIKHAETIEESLNSFKTMNNSHIDFVHSLELNSTPSTWQTWVFQPTLRSYPQALQSVCDHLVGYLKAYERQLTTLPSPIPLNLLRSPSGLFSIWQATLAQSSTTLVSQFTLLGAFTKTLLTNPCMTQLYIQGGMIEDGRLTCTDLHYTTPALQPCPVFLTWEEQLPKKCVRVPIYKDVSREELITMISIVIEERVDSAMLSLFGLALFIHSL